MRLKRVRQALARRKAGAFLVTDRKNTMYLSGFSGSSGALLITAPGPVFLLTDFRYAEQAGRECPGIETETGQGGLSEKLSRIAASREIKSVAFEPEAVSHALFQSLREKNRGVEFLPLRDFIRKMRAVKSDEEILKIRAACGAADRALESLKARIKPGASEIDIEAELLYYLKKSEGAGIAFPPVIAAGERASLPHGKPTARKIRSGDLILLDFGAELDGYCSDLTRTLCVGRMTPDSESLYKTVLSCQSECMKMLKPGLRPGRAFGFSRGFLRERGYDLLHGLGHGVGLDVHELPAVSDGAGAALRENMVFTVEPGVYLRGRFGVRIEDVVLLTASGPETLTRAPKNLKENRI